MNNNSIILKDQAVIYLKTIYRLFLDAMWRFKGIVSVVLLTDFGGMALQVTAIGQAIYYAKRLEQGTRFTLLGYNFDPRVSLSLLLLCALGFILTMLISAAFSYFSRSKALSLSRRYEELCIERVFKIMARPGSPIYIENSILADDLDMMKLAGSDSRLCGRSFLRMLILIVPLLTFFVSLGVLLWINFLLSLFLLIPGAFLSFLLMQANRTAASSFMGYEINAPATAAEKRSIIQRLKGLPASEENVEGWLRHYLNSGKIKENLDCYEQFLRTTELSHLFNGILLSVGVFLILLILGWKAISSNSQWSDLLIYMVAFRYTATSMRQVSANVIALSRFYPQVKRFFAFIDNEKIAPQFDESMVLKIKSNGTHPAFSNRRNQFQLIPGKRIGLLSPFPMNRYNVTKIMSGLFGKPTPSLWFATTNYNCPNGFTLRQCLGIDSHVTLEDILSPLSGTAHFEKWHQELKDVLDEKLSAEEWKKIRPGLKFLLAAYSGKNQNCRLVFLDEKGIRGAPGMVKNRLVDFYKDRIVFILFNDRLSNVGNYNEDVIAVFGNNGLVAIESSEWVKSKEEAIEEFLKETAKTIKQERDAGEVKDDLDIMSML